MYLLKEFFSKSQINLIRDPVYGFIEFPDELKEVIDHPLVQRLRWITQLPLQQLVYPSAQHSRFEHSIGTMYMAMQSMITLLITSSDQLKSACEKTFGTKKLNDETKRKLLLLAGIAGLLHDVGHGPFSHTIEMALNEYAEYKDEFRFDHETLSFLIAKKVLTDIDIKEFDNDCKNIVYDALNKNKELSDNPLSLIIRKLIDGPIDVDKGDYLLRDSYHCGVVYGIYDKDRLWRNIILTDDYRIAVTEKGALEAWSLRLARYKMHREVYFHHVRNITDSMLAEAIAQMVESNVLSDEEKKKLNPVANLGAATKLEDREVLEILYWTEHEFLKNLFYFTEQYGKLHNVREILEDFTRRNLYKRCKSIKLEELGFVVTNKLRLVRRLRKLNEEKRKSKELNFSFVIQKQILPPIFEKETQSDIAVKAGRKFVELAKYLGFEEKKKNEDEPEDRFKESSLLLEVFVDSGHKTGVRCRSLLKEIEKEIKEVVKNV